MIEVLVAGIAVETIEVSGVKQARTTVTYRFSLPEEPARVLLPTAYTSVRRPTRIPLEPKTIGDHIRKKRLSMKLLQKDVAERIGVKKETLYSWESNRGPAEVRYIPAIIEFLGYNPLLPATNWSERLVRHRKTLGIIHDEAARRMGVDPSTLSRWERGECERPALSQCGRSVLERSSGRLARLAPSRVIKSRPPWASRRVPWFANRGGRT